MSHISSLVPCPTYESMSHFLISYSFQKLLTHFPKIWLLFDGCHHGDVFCFYKRIKWSSGQPQVPETMFGFWLFDQLVLTSLLATGAFNKSLKISNINGSLATSDICPLWKQRRLILSPHEVKTKKKWEMFGLSVYMVISWMNPHNPTHNPLQWKILAAVVYLSPYPSYLMVE